MKYHRRILNSSITAKSQLQKNMSSCLKKFYPKNTIYKCIPFTSLENAWGGEAHGGWGRGRCPGRRQPGRDPAGKPQGHVGRGGKGLPSARILGLRDPPDPARIPHADSSPRTLSLGMRGAPPLGGWDPSPSSPTEEGDGSFPIAGWAPAGRQHHVSSWELLKRKLPRQGPMKPEVWGHRVGAGRALWCQHPQSGLATPSLGSSSQRPAAPNLRAKGRGGAEHDSQRPASGMPLMRASPFIHPPVPISSLVSMVTLPTATGSAGGIPMPKADWHSEAHGVREPGMQGGHSQQPQGQGPMGAGLRPPLSARSHVAASQRNKAIGKPFSTSPTIPRPAEHRACPAQSLWSPGSQA